MRRVTDAASDRPEPARLQWSKARVGRAMAHPLTRADLDEALEREPGLPLTWVWLSAEPSRDSRTWDGYCRYAGIGSTPGPSGEFTPVVSVRWCGRETPADAYFSGPYEASLSIYPVTRNLRAVGVTSGQRLSQVQRESGRSLI